MTCSHEKGARHIDAPRNTVPLFVPPHPLTGFLDMPTIEKAQHIGAVDYVTKPFGRELLLQALRRRATAALENSPLPPDHGVVVPNRLAGTVPQRAAR